MVTKCDYEMMLEWHPEMVLVSKSPVVWRGFLIISNLSYTANNVQYPRIKLKLIVPNYPSLCDAQVTFGRQIAAIRNKAFSQKLKVLMMTERINNKLTVLSFLRQLQFIIGQCMQNVNKKNHTIDLPISDLLQDLKAAVQNPSDVRISCNGSLSTIKLSLKGVSLVLQRHNSTEVPWQIISSDLPDIPGFEGFGKNISNLSIAVTKFKWQMELLEKTWEQLKEIDENCWVIEPLEPNNSHMYRRIHLSQFISITITIDPLHPTALPVIKFSGSDSEVKKQTDYVSDNILNWDQDCSILENLRMVLNMYVFPKQQESSEDNDSAIIGGRECGICFSAESDTNKLSDKICSNDRCMRHYHSACLSRWLQTKAENQVVFAHIHGICPHCKEKISCTIK